MLLFEDFEAWVKEMGGQKGLSVAFKRKLGLKIGQPAISGWLTKRRIPPERRPQLKKLGWDGPWDWSDLLAEVSPAYGAESKLDRMVHVREASRMVLQGIKERKLEGLLTVEEENQVIDQVADGLTTERTPGEIGARLEFLLRLAAEARNKKSP